MTEILEWKENTLLDPDNLGKVCAILNAGGLIVYPAVTLYGLGASIRSEKGLGRLWEVKKRPDYMPFSIMAIESDIRSLVEIPEAASAFFVENDTSITAIFRALDTTPAAILFKGTLAVRLPCSELCRSVVETAGPITATSANVHGQPAPSNLGDAVDQLGDAVGLYIDGGNLTGLPTSLVDFTSGAPEVLREGASSKKEVLARYG